MNQGNNEQDDLLLGKQLGPYLVQQKIGKGGMAEVYLATHQRLHRQVALKILRSELATSTNLQRFLQEARAAAALVHPNIVQVYDIGQQDSLNYIAQEYVAGANLKEHLQKSPRKRLGIRESISILLQVTAALQQSAAAGITHRDIKPENILLTPKGEAKVADFGLARAANLDGGELTRVNMTLGTPLYMSPEQIRGEVVDPRSDLYSLGVTLYHMLSGRPPFQGETPLSLAVQHLQNLPTDLANLRPDLPKPLGKLVHHLLEKDPADRPASPTALLQEIEAMKGQLPAELWPNTLIPLPTLQPHLTINSSVHAATVALAKLNDSRRKWLPIAGITLASMAAFTLAYYGFVRANPPLLPASTLKPSSIQKQESIEKQFLFAMFHDTELHWKAVSEFFPANVNETNRAYVAKADLQLAKWYRDHEQIDRATEVLMNVKSRQAPTICQTLASIELASIYRSQGDDPKAELELAEAQQLANQLDAPQKDEINRRLPSNLQDLWKAS
jgi:serine/threonine-protein kinase